MSNDQNDNGPSLSGLDDASDWGGSLADDSEAKRRTDEPGGDSGGMFANFDGAQTEMSGESISLTPKEKLIGERNETSVLFSISSLNNMDESPDAAGGAKNDEASGLIDINSLATTHAAMGGSQQAPQAQPLHTLPTGQAQDEGKGLMVGIVVLVVIVILALLGIIAYVMMGNKEKEKEPTKVIEKVIVKEVDPNAKKTDAKKTDKKTDTKKK